MAVHDLAGTLPHLHPACRAGVFLFALTMSKFLKKSPNIQCDGDPAAQGTTTDRIAGTITRFCGSMIFVWVHVIWFGGWILWNTIWPGRHMDPFPFSFLTLVVSLEAIFLSTFILISGNREGRINERRSRLDLQINLLAEQENTKMLQLLQEIAAKVGVESKKDGALAVLTQDLQPEKLLQQIDACVNEQDAAAEKSSAIFHSRN